MDVADSLKNILFDRNIAVKSETIPWKLYSIGYDNELCRAENKREELLTFLFFRTKPCQDAIIEIGVTSRSVKKSPKTEILTEVNTWKECIDWCNKYIEDNP